MKLFATLALTALMLTPTNILAQQAPQIPCGPSEKFYNKLEEKYNEKRLIAALQTDEKHMIEFFGSKKNGTWTILMTNTNGQSCLLFVGNKGLVVFDTIPGEGL